MADNTTWKFVVWERLNKTGKWCPYSAEVSQLLEQSYKKDLDEIALSDADESLKIYHVNFKDMVQISSITGTKSTIRRQMCSKDDLCNGFTWQWHDDHDVWHSYDVEVNNFIEKAYTEGSKNVTLKKAFRGYNYEIDFKKMVQMNKQTKRKRSIRRIQSASPYPVVADETTSDYTTNSTVCAMKGMDYSDLTKEVPGTDALLQQMNQYVRNVKRSYYTDDSSEAFAVNEPAGTENVNNYDILASDTNQNTLGNLSQTLAENNCTVALVNGRPWNHNRPPRTPSSLLKPVPGIDPLPINNKKTKGKKKVKLVNSTEDTGIGDILTEYTNEVNTNTLNIKDEDCIICCEPLSGGSSYDDDTTIMQLKLCPHIFHKSCLLAMYNCGSKDKCLQCPVCKKIHGVKYGIQPPGDMIYHVIPYSLPGHSDCDTIQIIYDIPSGTQGPEHPMPGKKYTSRGFPRHCYLPDNEMGRKVLRLLVKAWRRRLIFTIGRSSTTGEENTVTWNEIHHKTEFGCNRRGHGFPDPNYFNNVLAELEAHGVVDDDVYQWYPV